MKIRDKRRIRRLERDIKLMQAENMEMFGENPRNSHTLLSKLLLLRDKDKYAFKYEAKEQSERKYHDKFNNSPEIRSADFRSGSIDFQLLESGSYSECNFSNLKFINIRFNGFYYTDNDFSGADFINCRFCEETNCEYNNYSEAYFENTTFYKTDLLYASFRGAVFNNVKFFGCDFNEHTDFTECRFINVEIDGTYLRGSIFHNAELNGITIDKAYADSINIGSVDKPYVLYGADAYSQINNVC